MSQQKPAGKMFTRQAEEPFHVLCADFVGPLTRSKQGNTMLLVFFDAFSKCVELIPLRKATGAQLERAFREQILSRFGVPRTFVCDNSTQFTGRSFQGFCKSPRMEVQHTAPYTPRQNPTERANRTIKTMIAQYIDGTSRFWYRAGSQGYHGRCATRLRQDEGFLRYRPRSEASSCDTYSTW